MNNYEKAKEEGIKKIIEEFPAPIKVVVDLGGDKDEVDSTDILEDFLSSFAEKIKEGRDKDFERYVQHLPSCLSEELYRGERGMMERKECDCGLDKLLSSDSQTIDDKEKVGGDSTLGEKELDNFLDLKN